MKKYNEMSISEFINDTQSFICDGEKVGTRSVTKNRADEYVKFVMANKPAILAELHKRQEQIRNRKIVGLAELDSLEENWAKYRAEMDRDFEIGDGLFLGKPPAEKMEDAEKRYPEAAAYRKARRWAESQNWEKADLGIKAERAIFNGSDYKKEIAEMEDKWTKAANKHAFD